MKNKKFTLGTVCVTMHPNNFPKGFILKRDLTTSECRHLMYNLLGINIVNKEDCYDYDEYKELNQELTENVNLWLKGNIDDSTLMEYAGDCSDEPLGLFNMIPIISYLQKKEVI